MIRNGLSIVFIISLICSVLFQAQTVQAEEDLVIWIPFQEEVEKGLASYIDRGITYAEEKGASHIVFEMDTPGGAVDAATKIAKRMSETSIPITVFVNKKAISAGSYIALYADEIVMVPGSTMGASAIIDSSGNTAGKKAESFWLKEMEGAASLNNRDPIYARAMVDEDVDLPKYGAGKGKLLTLTANQALEVGYAEAVVDTKEDLLAYLNVSGATVETIEISFAERLARLITHPVVVPILLSIGSLGLVLELYTPGFGISGMMGLLSLALFFYGHLVAGLAGMESIILLIVGVITIVLELFVPGGILGILGSIMVVGSLLLAADNVGYMLFSILIAFIVAFIASVIMIKRFGLNKGVFRHIILSDATSTEKGYVSYEDRTDLVGLEGTTTTPLRPSGSADVNGKLLDVVSEGKFIKSGAKVRIVKAEGARIVVRLIDDE